MPSTVEDVTEKRSKAMVLKDLAREYGETKFFANLYVAPIG
jgi:hypothetical protein